MDAHTQGCVRFLRDLQGVKATLLRTTDLIDLIRSEQRVCLTLIFITNIAMRNIGMPMKLLKSDERFYRTILRDLGHPVAKKTKKQANRQVVVFVTLVSV